MQLCEQLLKKARSGDRVLETGFFGLFIQQGLDQGLDELELILGCELDIGD